jgi:hypothetical protein
MNIVGDFRLLIAIVIAVAGIAAAFVLRGILAKLVVAAVALILAAYVAGLLPPLRF